MQITFTLTAQDSSSTAAIGISHSLVVNNVDVLLTATLSLSANGIINGQKPASSTISITNLLYSAAKPFEYGRAMIPTIGAFGGEDSVLEGYGHGLSTLAPLTSTGDGGFYVPPATVYGLSNLRPLFSLGKMTTSTPGSGLTSLPALISKGGEGNYGEGLSYMQPLISAGVEGPPKGLAYLIADAYLLDAIGSYTDHIIVINETGQIVDTLSCTKISAASILQAMTASDDFTVIGEFLVSLSEEMLALGSMRGLGATGIQGDTDARVWVVNMKNAAPSQYDDYGFNSFFEDNGEYYGVADDGIYQLGGDNDAGADISALVATGKKDLGSPQKKGVVNVYVGVGSGDQVLLKVEADGQSYVYSARSNSTDIQNHRVDVGRGLQGNYFNFTLLNQDGCDFDLEGIHFEPIFLKRKI